MFGLLSVAWTGCSASKDPGSDMPSAITGPRPERFGLEFDGINDYASMGTADFPGSDAQTISLWVNYAPGNGGDDPQSFVVLRKFLMAGVHLGVRAGKLAAWRTSDQAVLVEGPVLPENSWHHVALTFDGNSRNTLFMDGVQVATSTATAFDGKLNINAYLGTFDGVKQMFMGQLDRVRIWTVAHTAAEIAAEMKGLPAAKPETLVGWWGFDEDGGALAYDYSGHGNTCVLGDGDPTRMPVRVTTTIPPSPAGGGSDAGGSPDAGAADASVADASKG